MKLNKFKIYLEYDPEYEGFIADVPTLPGCMSQGKTEQEALKNIHDNKEKRILFGQKIMNRVKKNFSIKNMISQTIALYKL